MEKKVIYVDIDGVICHTDGTHYERAFPIYKNINVINSYYNDGHKIVYWTARGAKSRKDYRDLTRRQLKSWGCKYHKLRMDKPAYDAFIEDKSFKSVDDFVYCKEYFGWPKH